MHVLNTVEQSVRVKSYFLRLKILLKMSVHIDIDQACD